jgi:hypothetical protein
VEIEGKNAEREGGRGLKPNLRARMPRARERSEIISCLVWIRTDCSEIKAFLKQDLRICS